MPPSIQVWSLYPEETAKKGENMTIEKASELVANLAKVDREGAIELFCYFEELFGLAKRQDEGRSLKMFAKMCGYYIAENVRRIN